jgi:hypothetical protein
MNKIIFLSLWSVLLFSRVLYGQERFVDIQRDDKGVVNVYKKNVKGLPPWQPLSTPPTELQRPDFMEIYNSYAARTDELRNSYVDYLTSKIANLKESMDRSQTCWPRCDIVDWCLQDRELHALLNGDYTRPVSRAPGPPYQKHITHANKRLKFEQELITLKRDLFHDVGVLIEKSQETGDWEFCYRLKDYQCQILLHQVSSEREYRYR